MLGVLGVLSATLHIFHIDPKSLGSRSGRKLRQPLQPSKAYQSDGQYGNTTSGSNRAALQEKIGAPIDVSREAVSTQSVPPSGARKSYRVSLFGALQQYCTRGLMDFGRQSRPACNQYDLKLYYGRGMHCFGGALS